MASPQVGSVSTKLSFAKVAAMKMPNVAITSPTISEDKIPRSSEASSRNRLSNSTKLQSLSPAMPVAGSTMSSANTNGNNVENVAAAIEGLSLVKDSSSTANGARSADSGESLEDDQSHLSNSSLKQQSFETKSMASVTTFAMDEKESIRPDDSASVRAVDDDDSIPTLSRNGTFQSESDVIMPTLRGGARTGVPGVTSKIRRFHTLTNPPRFGDLPVSPALEAEDVTQNESPLPADVPQERRVRMPSLLITPDDKLLDALATPKDRLPLLQLEEKLLAFINQSSIDFIDLPPQNSFARLLAHKLADYYSLAHHINEDGASIRIFRTPTLTLPTPLAIIAKSIPVGSAQPAAAMKIMRRAGLGTRQFSTGGSTAASSSAPSKTTSEAGLETNSDEGIMSPGDGTPNKDKFKLTREEREAQYRAARERIFGDFQESVTSESVSTGENSASMSRSSSSSGKKRTRKSKTPKDDSFEARSAFIPSYTPVHMHSSQAQYPMQYPEQPMYGNAAGSFSPNMNYGTTPTQSYPQFDQNMQFNNLPYGSNTPQGFPSPEVWSGMQSPPPGMYYQYPQTSSVYPQNMPAALPQMNNQFMQQSGPSMQPSPPWMNNPYQQPYQQPMTPMGGNTNDWSGYPAFQHGQVSSPQFPNNLQYGAQHPIPGSYNRNGTLFNPQTRSFIPSNTSNRNGGRNNNRKKTTSATSSNKSNSTPKLLGSDLSGKTVISQRGQDVSNSSSPKPKEDSLQQKYGTPANLPKKPPPPQAATSFDADTVTNVVPNVPSIMSGVGFLPDAQSTSSASKA